jgi:4-diphosphocytidyl-2-C-methyl-D-erythritol kinase
MKIRSYAKINIGLRVTAKRPDGYHNLETVFHTIDLFDTITLTQANELSIRSNIQALDIDPTNLCLRAATVLQREFGITQGVRMQLEKNIPIGAGLGGGSSNAAAVLLGLNQLWNLSLPFDQLSKLSLSLGSDVPFLLQGGTAYATGRGEILDPMKTELPFWIAIVVPPIHVSTAWAFEALHLPNHHSRPSPREIFLNFLKHGDNASIENDFESVVFRRHPEISVVKRRLLESGALLALMSGSGSSVFGLFAKEEQAQEALRNYSHPYRTFLTAPHFRPELSIY